MIVQACINGARRSDFHPLIPLTIDAMIREATASVAAGAAEIHVHPRGADGKESLAAVDDTVAAIRRVCPGTLIGVSTGAWIEGDPKRTRHAIGQWRVLPDYASVNLSEADAPVVMQLLRQKGVGIEVGLASVADAERYVSLDNHERVFRVLVELDDEQDLQRACHIRDGIIEVLERRRLLRPVLLHGFENTVWPFVRSARERGYSTRVGLEDGKHLPDGTIAGDNAALVAAAVTIFRG
ncbi:3-keto-5-aminohexanoate cleavage protein [Rhizobium bangladeshense]|uniref:3-keto-5-aminohexanoate cleavage protein n=1 Tax=Rhizobium bangladeshense TaxID=1138189 RepID=A0ABS7LRN8_9HYPH|nr:3-keto-5-aminohexanoate cleavage protein [Rhizobium bangladeshense]MBX4867957.1 3-keto-5-aminohexanoate cleavage protein [Rhizobium bangladeshense]MBX4875247.1 3-keto-5-aminohexanoate cleavage protein [Rhizobium bangladeshense]MBX4886159.1 3-keto-5-aminohexanoate cleavage protein [Rhizobium bangladeshense]MBX4899181.1 3-keto-5-aminohexanoate cleavage protein [Rhizobium bangladeshense]MBX4901874.1 3-keto-5-aminohexanoate cleavage protein [Rhizobium bangladeshense]